MFTWGVGDSGDGNVKKISTILIHSTLVIYFIFLTAVLCYYRVSKEHTAFVVGSRTHFVNHLSKIP